MFRCITSAEREFSAVPVLVKTATDKGKMPVGGVFFRKQVMDSTCRGAIHRMSSIFIDFKV